MEKLNILLVEDNPDDQLLAIRAFEQVDRKNKVVVVEDGEQALDYLYGTQRKVPATSVPLVLASFCWILSCPN